jgi:serine/threonine protein kinase
MIIKSLENFECTVLLGRGGMGEVYRAKDQKLGRDVAIKALSEEFAKDTERVARFKREAKLLASLSHPNIAAIYGLEESERIHLLILQLIEGKMLVDRLKQGSFPDLDSGGREQVSTNGGENPLWSPDGKELFYRGIVQKQALL